MSLLVLLGLEFRNIDWIKWFGLVLWTAVIFGLLGTLYSRDLRKTRCLLVFVGLLVVHTSALYFYLRQVEAFPNVFFLFFSPFEGAAIGVMLMLFRGAKPHREHRMASGREPGGDPGS